MAVESVPVLMGSSKPLMSASFCNAMAARHSWFNASIQPSCSVKSSAARRARLDTQVPFADISSPATGTRGGLLGLSQSYIVPL
jgi:hypothetical protein